MNKYQFFSANELRCKCGCGRGQDDMDPVFMAMLMRLRVAFDAPLPVTSGFRCPQHNQTVSLTGANGPHTTGKAVDIRIHGPACRALLKLALSDAFDFHGIGLQQHSTNRRQRFIHLDMLTERIWTY